MALLLCVLVLIPFRLSAATNDLSGLLQKGLFEEEANRNLDAAVQAYQALITAFDQDRKLAATAVFRLGECYRKLGKTNEAVLQYDRIVREFADETTLATLSRQNLAGLGTRTEASVSPAFTQAARQEQKRLLDGEIKLLEQDLAEAKTRFEMGAGPQADVRNKEREILQLRRQLAGLGDGDEMAIQLRDDAAARDAWRQSLTEAEQQELTLATRLKQIESLGREEQRQMVLQLAPNAVLDSLLKQITEAELSRLALRQNLADSHPEVITKTKQLDFLTKQADAQVEGAIRVLKSKRDALGDRIKSLQARLAAAGTETNTTVTSKGTAAGTVDDEETQIRRLEQALARLKSANTPEEARKRMQQKLAAATEQVDKLRVSLSVPDEIAVMDAAKGMDDPRLAKYRAYFEAKHSREEARRFAKVLEMKLASDEIDNDLLRQFDAKEGSPTPEAVKSPEKP